MDSDKIKYFKKQSLFDALPEIVKIWHSTKNKLTPDIVGKCSSKKVWWICEKGHEWQAAIYSVASNYKKGHSGCPYCCGKRVNKENCLLKIFPEIAKEWHPTKNGDITPSTLGKGSTKVVW